MTTKAKVEPSSTSPDDGVKDVSQPAEAPIRPGRRATARNALGGLRSALQRVVWPLLLVAVAGLVGTIGFWRAWDDNLTEGDDVAEMEETARNLMVAFLNFDADTIGRDFDRVRRFAAPAGGFRAEADRLGDENLRRQIREVQASSRGEVKDVFAQSYDGDTGRVYVVADQTAANNQFPRPISDTVRAEVSLVTVDGEWKVNEFLVLEAPTLGSGSPTGVAPPGAGNGGGS